MQYRPFAFLMAAVTLCWAIQADSRIPRNPPPKMSVQLRPDFETARGGDVFAMLRINHCYGHYDAQVFPSSLIREKLEKLVNQGNPKAMVKLADNLPWDQEHPEKDKALEKRSKKLIEQAAWLGEPSAMSKYVWDLWRYEKNKEEAIKWWIKGKRILEEKAKQGAPDSIIELAGYGGLPTAISDAVLIDSIYPDKERVSWMRKAAEIDRESALQLGLRLSNEEGAKWIEKAANEGDWVAMVEMGRFYAFGFPSGGEKNATRTGRSDLNKPVTQSPSDRMTDPAKAWEWWDKAAELVGWELVDGRLPESGSENFPKRPEKK